MRFLNFLVLLGSIFLLPGCDKIGALMGAGELGGGTGAAVEPGGDPDPTMARLVNRTVDGVCFRRDLEFPTSVKGRQRVTRAHNNFRIVETSALGNETKVLNHRTETEFTYNKGPGRYRMKLVKSGRRLLEKEEEASPEAAEGGDLEGESLDFILTETGWQTRGSQEGVEFKTAVWADALNGHVPKLMVECGAHPRVQWFSSSRTWQTGDRIVLTGSANKMLMPFDVTGRVELVFEGEEAIAGHPCGVFSLSGDLSVRGEVTIDGRVVDREASVSEGRIWASLLYPILLREEYETVETVTDPGSKGSSVKMQGGVKIVRSRSWEPEAG